MARLGIDPARCIHTHPIKRDKDIRNALHAGVKIFVADNPDEVRKFRRYRADAELLLRVSFRSPGAVSDLSRKFGCDPEGALELARLAAQAWHPAARLLLPRGLAGAAMPLKHVEAIEACVQLLKQGAPREAGPAATSWTSAAAFPSTTPSACRTSAASARPSARRWPACRRTCA